jgi:hypothetical protein
MNGFGYLSDYFEGVAAKRLSAVEVDALRSHQHEFNGVAAMKQLWGAEKKEIPAHFLYLGGDDDDRINEEGNLTWYDSRENHPIRSEFRLYYQDNAAMQHAAPGDLAIIAKRDTGRGIVIIAKSGSSYESRLIWLFRLSETTEAFAVEQVIDERDREADYLVRSILEELQIEAEPADTDYLDLLLGKFGPHFPSTAEFSEFARLTLDEMSITGNPDHVLMTWFEREELLFRTLEKHIVGTELESGFADVDEFISYSLSVHNRRKSRVGYALEHHLARIFSGFGLSYSRNGITEKKATPDFMFPGIRQYHDPAFPTLRLTMLGVKSTCKDRWRQVLSEAARIDHKHLFTLEGGISVAQTEEMGSHNLTLVLPASLQSSFNLEQQKELLTLAGFIELVAARV